MKYFGIKHNSQLVNHLQRINLLLLVMAGFLFFISCGNYFKNDYKDNSPTSGQLKLYFDEGLQLHAKNQAFTFQSQYANAKIDLIVSTENEAIEALYKDSCEAVMISRVLNEKEKAAFASKKFFPKYSAVAHSGVAIITNIQTSISGLSMQQISTLLKGDDGIVKDSTGTEVKLRVLLDRNNSSVMHYLIDSLLAGNKFSSNCSALNSSPEAINYVAQNKNTIAFIDFAWLSDVDDSITKANHNKVKFIGIKEADRALVYPSQSTFKLGTYPLATTIYVMRKTGDFSLAKGFESFVAGPKGQLTFLKQGLLPAHQAERLIEVKFEPIQQQ